MDRLHAVGIPTRCGVIVCTLVALLPMSLSGPVARIYNAQVLYRILRCSAEAAPMGGRDRFGRLIENDSFNRVADVAAVEYVRDIW